MNLTFALAYTAGLASMLIYGAMRARDCGRLVSYLCSLIPSAIALVVCFAAGWM